MKQNVNDALNVHSDLNDLNFHNVHSDPNAPNDLNVHNDMNAFTPMCSIEPGTLWHTNICNKVIKWQRPHYHYNKIRRQKRTSLLIKS